MAALTSSQITDNGTYTVKLRPGEDYTVLVAGTFGSGTLTFTLLDESHAVGVVIPTYGAATAASTFAFTAPCNQLQMVLADATDPVLTVILTQVPR